MDEREFLKKLMGIKPTNEMFIRELMYKLATSGFMSAYILGSDVVINNFLRASVSGNSLDRYIYNADGSANMTREELDELTKSRQIERDYLKSGGIYTDSVLYNPVTKNYMGQLLLLDKALRASKQINEQPQKLYRGTVELSRLSMNSINSFAGSIEEAANFGRGTILEVELPPHFPYIDINQVLNTPFSYEKEFLLPPCEFEVIKKRKQKVKVQSVFAKEFQKFGMLKQGIENYGIEKEFEVVTVALRPKNLAKEFLQRMRKPPKDYPLLYINNPAYEFGQAKIMLEAYIKNQVMQGKIIDGDMCIKEYPDPAAPRFDRH